MNIQERKNKDGKITSYRVRVFDHRDVTTGKQIFKNLSVKYEESKSELWNRKNAEKQGAIFEKSVGELTATTATITFKDYSNYCMTIKEQSGVKKSTIHNYNVYLKKLMPYIGHIRLKDLTPNALNRAYADLLKDGTSKKYVYELHALIRTILATAFKEGIIPRNYATAASPPRNEKAQVKALTMDEVNALFTILQEKGGSYAEIKNEIVYMYNVFFTMLLATGCRVGELCALNWSSVDFEEKCVEISQHWVLDENGRHIDNGAKTTAGKRCLYLDERVMKMLSDYRNFYITKSQKYGTKWNHDINAVFSSCNKPGDYLDPNTVRNWLTPFLAKHGLSHTTPHKFRHTSISLQLESGISFVDVAKRAGHARPDVTLSIYAHTMRNNDIHCCEAVSSVIPTLR